PLGDLVERLQALEAGGGSFGAASGGAAPPSRGARSGGARPSTRGGARMAPQVADEDPRPAAPRRAPIDPTRSVARDAPEDPATRSRPDAGPGDEPEFDSALTRDLWNVVKASGLVGRSDQTEAAPSDRPGRPEPEAAVEASSAAPVAPSRPSPA